VATRFKPGVSGNPRGRPKAPKSAGKSLKDAMARYMTVVENGKKRKVRAQELIMQSLVNDVARGKPHAVKLLFSLADRYAQNDEQDIDPANFAADDLAVIDNYLVSIQTPADGQVDDTLLVWLVVGSDSIITRASFRVTITRPPLRTIGSGSRRDQDIVYRRPHRALNQSLRLQRAHDGRQRVITGARGGLSPDKHLVGVQPMAFCPLHGRQAGDQIARISESGERPPVIQLDRLPESVGPGHAAA
jgi:hypothetical protein